MDLLVFSLIGKDGALTCSVAICTKKLLPFNQLDCIFYFRIEIVLGMFR